MSARQRLPGLQHGQIYTYPSKRWRKKRRQYLMHYLQPKRIIRGDIEDGMDVHIDGVVSGMNEDSKDSLALKGLLIYKIKKYSLAYNLFLFFKMSTVKRLGIMMTRIC